MKAAGWTEPSADKSATGHNASMPDHAIENYIGENMHEFTIATVYEGPNPVLSDVGAPNAMTRSIRGKYLEPIGIAEVNGGMGLKEKAKFGAYVAKTVAGSFVSSCDMSGVENRFDQKDTYILSLIHI